MHTDFDLHLHVFRSPKFRSVVKEAVEFFDETPLHDLPPAGRFSGGGVYALYYLGDCEYYKPISELNKKKCSVPIYVGKAVPPGWRTGRFRESGTPDLCGRLREHAGSIRRVSDLLPQDFKCRFMLLTDKEADLVVPVEAELIRRDKPVWNTLVDGFGNHDPGAGRYDQAPSEWDALHSGRVWTHKLRGKAPQVDKIIENIRGFLNSG